MAGSAPEDDHRLSLQLSSVHKARKAQAATTLHTAPDRLVTQAAQREADAGPVRADTARVSLHDFTRILELLENPPAPNARLRAAIAALPDTL
jgi:uncharacterized protein (DUF1778 family)